jgi:hypothetical protein
MASRILIDTALKLYKSLGGNVGKVLGTRTNVNFLGKGKSPEMMVDMDINPEALGVLSKSKAVSELDSAMGYLTSNKLNDMQANQLIKNMNTMKTVYDPPAPPANITDLATRTRNLDEEGLMSLRMRKTDDELAGMAERLGLNDPNKNKFLQVADDLPPPGSRGGPDDIAAPFSGSGIEALKNVKNNDLIMNDVVNKIYLNAGVSANAQPAARANAREFLNRIKNLSDEPGNTTLSDVMEIDDFKFMTEGGGGGMGDPLLLVQKYFGPKVASSVAQLDNADDIQKFAENLIKIKDARGNTVTSRFFDPESISPDDFKFEDGGRVGYFGGARVLGKMGYQALRKYGIEAEDITRLFANLGADKTLRGKEKTMYFQQLHKVLRNPDQYPEGVMDIQKQLGLDIGIGFRNGGLAGLLEV